MMNKRYIDHVIAGLVATVGSRSPYDICSYLNISIDVVDPTYILLAKNEAVYLRAGNMEKIYISSTSSRRTFVLAHELGHAMLHVSENIIYYNPFENFGRLERQADYFATILLYGAINLEELSYLETKKNIALSLNLPLDCVNYLIEN